MDPTAAKYIGAGIACIGMGGAGVGVGIIFGNYLAAALRNPSAAGIAAPMSAGGITSSRFCLLAQESRIESRIASRGNHASGACQTSKNVTLSSNDAFATLHCVSLTHAHNMVRQCCTSCGNLSRLKALEHVVCLHRHTAALFFKLLPASYRCCMSASSLRNIVVGGRN